MRQKEFSVVFDGYEVVVQLKVEPFLQYMFRKDLDSMKLSAKLYIDGQLVDSNEDCPTFQNP